jgi:hypothetical protein
VGGAYHTRPHRLIHQPGTRLLHDAVAGNTHITVYITVYIQYLTVYITVYIYIPCCVGRFVFVVVALINQFEAGLQVMGGDESTCEVQTGAVMVTCCSSSCLWSSPSISMFPLPAQLRWLLHSGAVPDGRMPMQARSGIRRCSSTLGMWATPQCTLRAHAHQSHV